MDLMDKQKAIPGIDLNKIDHIVARHKDRRWPLIPLLQEIQQEFGYIPPESIKSIAQAFGLFPAQVQGVITFYEQLYTTPRGKKVVRVCRGTACHVRGASKCIETVEKQLGVPAGGTSEDYEYTMEIVYCLGSCGLAPVAVVDDKVYGRLTPNSLIEQLEKLG